MTSQPPKSADPSSHAQSSHSLRLAGRIAHSFINSKLTPLVIVARCCWEPSHSDDSREEEPQIVVPMLDVFVQMPGASAEEVHSGPASPWRGCSAKCPGSSTSTPSATPSISMLVVRFYVGTKEEDAIVKTYNKLYSNFDRIPAGVSQPIIKVRSIDDVPIMALTLWGKNYDCYHLRQIAGELENSLKQIDDVSETKIIGGLPRQLRVVLDTQRLAAYGMTAGAVAANCRARTAAARREASPATTRSSRSKPDVLHQAEDLQQVVVGVHAGSQFTCATWRRNRGRPRRARHLRAVCQCSWRRRKRRPARIIPR